ncbi:MAG TPA: ankyrin repeat domain-containing protein [Gemmatimonadales bacterium]|nr:ankyrin repeat domain-containing protein [Gemmatimonadales bacterium]
MPTFADLQTAIRERNAARVREILAAAPDLAGTRPPTGPSALLLAAYMGGGEIADLLRSRVALDACEAAALGAVSELKQLLDEHPARTNARSGDGWTPLHLAGFFGRREAAELLLARGASLSAISGGAEKNQPLHAALAGACDPVIVRALVAHGADVNAAAAADYTPLHVAASRGNAELVRFLVESGARTDARMDDGKTPADLARDRGHPEVAKLLEGLAPPPPRR